MDRPLEGVKVIDFTAFVAGASAGKLLADWGADVIKLEPLSGDPGRCLGASLSMRTDDGSNPLWETFNGNKRSLSLDLKTAGGQEIIARLLSAADIFISNYRQAALARLGLDYETVSAVYPRLIWGHLSGYGPVGPDADKPGFDAAAFWARSGALRDVAERDGYPLTNPYGMGDTAAGCSLAGGVAACLLSQARTCRGQRVDVSLYGTAVWHSSCLVQSTWHGDEWPRSRKQPFSALCNSFCCRDGQWFYLSIFVYQRFFPLLCRLIGREELLADPRFSTEQQLNLHCAEFTEILDAAFRTRDYAEWDKLLTEADMVHDRIGHFRDVSDDPQAIANGFIQYVADREGNRELIPCGPVRFGRSGAEHRLAPRQGEYDEEILITLGFTQQDLARLRKEKAIL